MAGMVPGFYGCFAQPTDAVRNRFNLACQLHSIPAQLLRMALVAGGLGAQLCCMPASFPGLV